MSNYEALSYCGVFCGKCANYKKNVNCAGCRNECSLVDDCPTRACAITRGFFHCGECYDFPCKVLNDFYNDGKPLHLKAYHNMQDIMKKGHDEWLKEQNENIDGQK